jgi:hypothetical protein
MWTTEVWTTYLFRFMRGEAYTHGLLQIKVHMGDESPRNKFDGLG